MPPNFGDAAEGGADVTDSSAQINVTGANGIASLAEQERAEIAAVPDPQSPAGQAQILAIIEKYQRLAAGTVDESAASEQANGAKAASSGKDDDDDDSSKDELGGGGVLQELLSTLLGAGGSMGSGMGGGMGGGSDPFGQGQQSPFDQYGAQGSASPAVDPFADMAGPSGSVPVSNYDPAADPFAAAVSTGSAQPLLTDAALDTGGQTADQDGGGEQSGGESGASGAAPAAAATGEGGGGVDASAFSGAAGADVPADPAA